MKWVTRRSIRVNRTATAWLVRRFLDPEAKFLFVAPEEVVKVQKAEGAIGFDAPGALMTRIFSAGLDSAKPPRLVALLDLSFFLGPDGVQESPVARARWARCIPAFPWVRGTRHSVTRNALHRVIAVFGAPAFAGGGTHGTRRRATPVPLHLQLMPDTGACGKPRVMPHGPGHKRETTGAGGSTCTTNPHALRP